MALEGVWRIVRNGPLGDANLGICTRAATRFNMKQSTRSIYRLHSLLGQANSHSEVAQRSGKPADNPVARCSIRKSNSRTESMD
jgi:hypothetical protein